MVNFMPCVFYHHFFFNPDTVQFITPNILPGPFAVNPTAAPGNQELFSVPAVLPFAE